MTRDERIAKLKAETSAAIADKQRQLARYEAEERARESAKLARRRTAVGKLAEEAGLLAWDDAVLRPLFTALATLRDVPNPVALLATALELTQPVTVLEDEV